ncbi:MAG: YkgJ family cysteine cluster protein [Actinomycetota bacterium]
MTTPLAGSSPLKDAAFAAAARTLAAAVPKGVAATVDAMWAATAAAEALWAETRTTPSFALGTPPAACKRGCGWCCHQPVGALALEVLAIAEALPAEARARLDAWQPGRPCAFLDAGACTIYELRPLKCRSLYHLDVRHCMQAYAGMAVPLMGPKPSAAHQEPPMDVFTGTLMGAANALWRAGRDCPGVEFMPALKAAAARPDATAAWWRGDAVFPADARLDWFPKPAKGRRRR